MLFNDKIIFESHCGLNCLTRFTDTVATFFLSPIRYLSKGQTVRCVFLNSQIAPSTIEFHPVGQSPRNWLKVVIAVLLLIPGTILGGIIKSSVLLCSFRLKELYRQIPNEKSSPAKQVTLLPSAEPSNSSEHTFKTPSSPAPARSNDDPSAGEKGILPSPPPPVIPEISSEPSAPIQIQWEKIEATSSYGISSFMRTIYYTLDTQYIASRAFHRDALLN